jgi:uncharacterized protein YndB with AHSA1/START domain
VAKVSVSGLIPAPQPAVWALLSDIANANRWNQAWTGIEFTSNQTHGTGTRFRAHTEDGNSYEFEIATWSAPEHLEIRPLRGPEEPRYPVMLESHEFRLASIEGGESTMLDLRANATAHGIRGRLFAALIWPGHQKEGLGAAIETIAGVFAAEEDKPSTEPESPSDPLPT